MKLIVGLGNPGKEFNNTRHNIGFMFVDKYLNDKFGVVEWKSKFNGLYFQTMFNGEKVIFLKPLSYMNLSGEVVKKYSDYFKVDISDILVVSDDMDLNIGNYKLRLSGSCGGHNGLRNIEQLFKSINYKRLKIGISNHGSLDAKDYVLGSFSRQELDILNDLFNILTSVIDDYFVLDFADLMCKYNRKNR